MTVKLYMHNERGVHAGPREIAIAFIQLNPFSFIAISNISLMSKFTAKQKGSLYNKTGGQSKFTTKQEGSPSQRTPVAHDVTGRWNGIEIAVI